MPVKVDPPDVSTVPPVQTENEISKFLWTARASGFLSGAFTVFSLADVFPQSWLKWCLLGVSFFGFVSSWCMGQVPSAKQRSSSTSK